MSAFAQMAATLTAPPKPMRKQGPTRPYERGIADRLLRTLGDDSIDAVELAVRMDEDKQRVSFTLWNLRKRGLVKRSGHLWSKADPSTIKPKPDVQAWSTERVNAFLARVLA